MKNRKIEFSVSIESFDPSAWKLLKDAREAVAKIEQEILKSYRESDRAKAASDLAGTNAYGKVHAMTRIQFDSIVTETYVCLPDENTTQHLNVGEKTLNLLLTGKLLTDDQKKSLLKRIGVDLQALTTP